jgi:DNA-binding transcriptional regulator YhcF (GntR family)
MRRASGPFTTEPEKQLVENLSVDALFDAAVRIQLLERSVTVSFTPDQTIRITFPATRRLAEFLSKPHSVVLRTCALMEQEELVTKAERVGIVTTKKGSRKMLSRMKDGYLRQTSGILGTTLVEELLKKT